MEERKFEVLTASSSTRCEICHQADRFDPFTETCLRCQALIVTQALSEVEAARYQEWQQTLSYQPDVRIPTSDLFRVMGEALRLFRRNFLLFVGILAIVKIAESLFIGIGFAVGAWLELPIYPLALVTWLVSILLAPFARGAMLKTILDRYRGEKASLFGSFSFIFRQGFRYLLTSLIGDFYQMLGFFLLIVGIVYTYPRGAFMSEVAIVEERYYLDAYRRSSQLGTRNTGMILLFGLARFICGTVIPYVTRIMFILVGISLSKFFFGFQEIFLLVLTTIISTFFFVTEMLLYFHLRMRTDELIKFKFDPEKAVLPNP